MPKGKGTYGHEVGRPKEYNKGGLLRGLSHEEGGIPILAEGGEVIINSTVNDAAGIHEEDLLALNENPENYEIVPTSNAMDRSQTFQLGGAVQSPTAPSIPQAPQYKKGGKVGNFKGEKVDVTDIVKKVSQREKLKKMHGGKSGRKGINLKKQAKRYAREVIEQSEWPGEDWGKEKKK